MTSKTRNVDGGVIPRVFMGQFVEHIRFEKNRRFTKDIQIHIDKPKQREPFLKTKTLHFDGGGWNTQFETSRI